MKLLPVSIIFQGAVAIFPEPPAVVLGADPGKGIVPGDSVPLHEPGNAHFLRGGDGNGQVAQLCQAPFKQADGINGCQLRPFCQLVQHRLTNGGVGDAVEIQQGLLIGKDHRPQLFALEPSIRHHTGKPLGNGRQQSRIRFQKAVVDGIAVQHHGSSLPQKLQKGGLSAAGAPGDAQDHSSASASTMWKAAAFFSRFWTA